MTEMPFEPYAAEHGQSDEPPDRPVPELAPAQEWTGERSRIGVVLAAGRSQRLGEMTGGGSKALVRLGGLSLVERAVRILLESGIERVLVVVGYHAGPVAAVVGRIAPGRVRAVHAERWEEGNGESLAAVQRALAGEGLFTLVTTDHVFDEGALDALLRAREPAVLVDTAPGREAWLEGTRVRIHEEMAVAFGKQLDEPAIDCGAFVLPPEVFECQQWASAEGDHSLAGAVTRLAGVRALRAIPLRSRCWWQDVDTPYDLRLARSGLRRSLVKDTDGPVARYLNRPISTRVSMALAPLRLSPDLVSIIAFLMGLTAAWLIASGAGVIGGILVQASSVVDGVDGELARLQVRAGPRGAMLDGILDRLGDAAILAAVGVWAIHDGSFAASTVVALAVAATTGSILSMATKDRGAALGLPPAPERSIGLLLGGRDGRLLLLAVGAVLGTPVPALVAVTVTSALSLVIRLYFLVRAVPHLHR